MLIEGVSVKFCLPSRKVTVMLTVMLKSGQNRAKFGEVDFFDKVIGRKREKATVSNTERFVGECENMKKIYAEVMTNVELNLHG